MITVFTRADLPDDLMQQWLQHLRDFDVAHPGCHFEIMADAPTRNVREMAELLRVEPELTFTEIFERKQR
jgi:hypothetical protein